MLHNWTFKTFLRASSFRVIKSLEYCLCTPWQPQKKLPWPLVLNGAVCKHLL